MDITSGGGIWEKKTINDIYKKDDKLRYEDLPTNERIDINLIKNNSVHLKQMINNRSNPLCFYYEQGGNKFIYSIGGDDTMQNHANMEIYDINNDKWSQENIQFKKDKKILEYNNPCGGKVGDKIYIFGV